MVSVLISSMVKVAILKLKSGADSFSKLKVPALIDLVGQEYHKQICNRFRLEMDQSNAMRWILRGLPLDLAMKKVDLIKESRDKFSQRSMIKDDIF